MIKQNLLQMIQAEKVEWKTLGEVAKISSGGTPKTEVDAYYNGDIPWLRTQEVNFGEIWDTDIKITEEGVANSSAKWVPANSVILAMYGATVGKVAMNRIPLTTNQACANIQVDANYLNYRYLFYYLYNKYEYIKSLGTGSQTNINAQIVKGLKIPIPSLSVQQRIVEILDKFTACIDALNKEHTLRKKQYAYYRDLLLSEAELSKVGFEWKTLGEVCQKICSGGTPKTENPAYWENGSIPWMSSGEVNLGTVYATEKFITELGVANSSAKLIPKNSVVIALAGQGKTRGKVARIRLDLTTNQSLAALVFDETTINPDYVFHFLSTQYDTFRQISSGEGVRGGLNLQMIKDFKIPLPPLAHQHKIVDILDRFDTLTHSITQGLPREIELRRKQYEYYRELLLTFDKSE